MDWCKKHVDTVMILTAIISSMLWMNHQFNSVDARFATLEKEIAIIKTVLVMKQILPVELCKNADDKK